jgi:hypothetical protein
MAKSVAQRHTFWMGWDLRTGSHAQADAADHFEQSAPTYPSAETRYELIAVAARGFRPPHFVTSTDVDTAKDRESASRVEYPGLRQTWSTLYQRIAETGPSLERPFAIYLLGVNPPADASPTDLEAFNDFYTNVHLVEVAERRHALRATRYELVEEVRPPYQGAPRFLATYELDEKSAANRRHVGPPYSAGPDVWQRHTTPWRLWYRQLGA